MAKNYRSSNGFWVPFLLLVAGGLAGSAIANSLAKTVPFLANGTKIGWQPATLDLNFVQLTLGFTLHIGPLTALGLVLGYIAYRKM